MSAVFFEAATEFLAACPKIGTYMSPRSFAGGESYDESRRNLLKGKAAIVKQSEHMMQDLMGETVETSARQWSYDLMGAQACVPSYLAGAPESMRRQIHVQSEHAPVRIFASVCGNAFLSSDQMSDRGTAILAFARKLQALRPVELYAYAEMEVRDHEGTDHCIPVLRIETSPMDLTTASYIFGSCAFFRQLCMNYAGQFGYDGVRWKRDQPDQHQAICQALDTLPEDIVITGAYNSDPLIENPVKWVNDQMQKYLPQD